MHKNKIWLAFLIALSLATAWFGYSGVKNILHYHSFAVPVKAHFHDWDIYPKEDRYVVEVVFTYTYGDTRYTQREDFGGHRFRNEWAAKRFVSKLKKKKTREVWIDPANPEKVSLAREFPWKTTLYASVMLLIWGYFVWLGFYVGKRSAN